MQIKRTLLIGAGGIGGWLAEPLARLLRYHPEAGAGPFLVADGDIYEEKNATRQAFPLALAGQSKALVTTDRLAGSLGTLAGSFIPIHDYVTKESLAGILATVAEEGGTTLVVPAVDNMATRKAVVEALVESAGDFLLVCPGNELETASVFAWARVGGAVMGVHPFDRFPNLANPTDWIPGTVPACMALVPSTPQLLSANFAAAWGVLLTVQAWLDGAELFDEWRADIRKAKGVGVGVPFNLGGKAATDAPAP